MKALKKILSGFLSRIQEGSESIKQEKSIKKEARRKDNWEIRTFS